MQQSKAMTIIELLIVAAILALLLAVAVPGLGQSQNEKRLTECTKNLRRLGQANYIYAQDDPGTFPCIGGQRKQNDGAMVIFDPKNREKQPSSDGIPSPTVDLWALLREEYNAKEFHLQPKDFICPVTKDVPDPAQDPSAYHDFLSAENLSYAFQFQHDPNRRVLGTSSEPTFPLMADANPYIKGGVKKDFAEDRLSKYRGNSKNHGKARPGQNVLFQDGHVTFEKSPDCGLSGKADPDVDGARGRDNCYTVHSREGKGYVDPGSAAPTATQCNLGSKSDACLVP
ncbi:MAG TPA: hypothetical protein VMV94_05100 [Phycisphaerae bacterium]|nr:hypothetical protein [Phycisphaerae bacterium]